MVIMQRQQRLWIPVLASGLGACSMQQREQPDASMSTPPDTRVPDTGGEGTWGPCCPGDHASIPGGMARGSGTSLECFCPDGITCNYGMGACFRDAGTDSSTPVMDDSGFADAGPIDDAAVDALVADAP